MKRHFLSLLNPTHRWLTISFSLASVLLFIACALKVRGIVPDPFHTFLVGGMVFLFFALLHPWREYKYYFLLAGVCSGILILQLVLLVTKVGDGWHFLAIMILIALICVSGIVVGILGSIFCAIRLYFLSYKEEI